MRSIQHQRITVKSGRHIGSCTPILTCFETSRQRSAVAQAYRTFLMRCWSTTSSQRSISGYTQRSTVRHCSSVETSVCYGLWRRWWVGTATSRARRRRRRVRARLCVSRARILEDNYAADVSLDTLAKLVALSPFHLARLFQREVGMPPHAYQVQVRISHAKQLLLRGLPISRVATDTGFFDTSHFTRHFKRQVGVTPGGYALIRKNVQSGRRSAS